MSSPMAKQTLETQERTNLTTYSERIMSTLYSTKVTATGGRHGQIRSEDGLLDMKLARLRRRPAARAGRVHGARADARGKFF
jgi:hypothetical protein